MQRLTVRLQQGVMRQKQTVAPLPAGTTAWEVLNAVGGHSYCGVRTSHGEETATVPARDRSGAAYA